MGRDWSVLAQHPALEGEHLRAMLEGEEHLDAMGPQVRFALKPGKVHIFRKDTGERIAWDGQKGGMGQ